MFKVLRLLSIVTVLGLVGGVPGGRHRASPIHRRRAGPSAGALAFGIIGARWRASPSLPRAGGAAQGASGCPGGTARIYPAARSARCPLGTADESAQCPRTGRFGAADHAPPPPTGRFCTGQTRAPVQGRFAGSAAPALQIIHPTRVHPACLECVDSRVNKTAPSLRIWSQLQRLFGPRRLLWLTAADPLGRHRATQSFVTAAATFPRTARTSVR